MCTLVCVCTRGLAPIVADGFAGAATVSDCGNIRDGCNHAAATDDGMPTNKKRPTRTQKDGVELASACKHASAKRFGFGKDMDLRLGPPPTTLETGGQLWIAYGTRNAMGNKEINAWLFIAVGAWGHILTIGPADLYILCGP